MRLHKLPLIMAFDVQENAVFIHEFSKNLPHSPPARLLRSLALPPPPPPPLTNPGCTTVTGIAKGHNALCPAPFIGV